MSSGLRFAKGDFIGADKNTVPLGTKYLAIVLEARRGIVRWGTNGITDSHVGLIREHYLTPHRESLGDEDETKWSLGPGGVPRDPWQQFFSVPMVELTPPHSELMWTGSSWGAKECLQDLIKAYLSARHLHVDGSHPVIELASFNKPTKSFGNVKQPRFPIVGWATLEDVKAGRKVAAAKIEKKSA
jgi:hypothetical protein